MSIDKIIGFDSAQPMFAQVDNSSLKAIQAAVWRVGRVIVEINADEGYLPIFYPGPVLGYSKEEQGYSVKIWTNGGKRNHARDLYDKLSNYKIK